MKEAKHEGFLPCQTPTSKMKDAEWRMKGVWLRVKDEVFFLYTVHLLSLYLWTYFYSYQLLLWFDSLDCNCAVTVSAPHSHMHGIRTCKNLGEGFSCYRAKLKSTPRVGLGNEFDKRSYKRYPGSKKLNLYLKKGKVKLKCWTTKW